MRFQRRTYPDTVVVDFSRGTIQMALAESAGEAVRFHGITCLELPTPEGEDELALGSPAVAEALEREVGRHGWKGMRAAVLLPGSATSSQSFLLPPLSEAETRRALELRLPDTLHFEFDQAEFNFRRTESADEESMEPEMVLTAAARRDVVQAALVAVKAAGLVPRAVGSASESLANLSQCVSLWHTEEASIHVDVGATSTVLNLFEGKQLRFSREVDIGGAAFVAALTRPILLELETLELSESEATLLLETCGMPMEDEEQHPLPFGVRGGDVLPLLEPLGQRLAAEIARSIDYLSGLLERTGIDRIVLSGTAGRMRNLERFLEERLGTRVVNRDPVDEAIAHWRLAVFGEAPSDLASFATILGYSLGQRRPINLLPREEQLEQAVERFSRRRRAAVLPAIAASGAMALAGIPILRDYDGAERLLLQRSEQLAAELAALDEVQVRQADAQRVVERVNEAGAAVPDWLGLLKELSLLVPEGVELELVEVDAMGLEPNAYVTAWVHPGEVPFDILTTTMTTELAGSPLFRDAHVVEASVARDGQPSRFELRLELIAAPYPGGAR